MKEIVKTKVTKIGLDEKAPISINISGNIDSPFNWLQKRVLPTGYSNQINQITDDAIIAKMEFEDAREEANELSQEPISEERKEEMASRMINALQGIVDDVHLMSTVPNTDHMIEQQEAHILIDRDKMKIHLIFNEINPFLKGSVVGALAMHPDFEKWGINQPGETWDHEELAEFIKMNRSCFDDRNDAMKLSAGLKKLRVNVEKEMEKFNDNKGNYRMLAVQKVQEMSIPDQFSLCVPIFKGQNKISFNVEIYIDPNNYKISLVSPEANDAVSEVRDNIIDEQKQKIQDIAPELVIIEQ